MILSDGTDTREHGIGLKFSNDMAVYLDNRWMNGDFGDEFVTNEVSGEGVARYGKWLLIWNSLGFVGAEKFDSPEQATETMTLWAENGEI